MGVGAGVRAHKRKPATQGIHGIGTPSGFERGVGSIRPRSRPPSPAARRRWAANRRCGRPCNGSWPPPSRPRRRRRRSRRVARSSCAPSGGRSGRCWRTRCGPCGGRRTRRRRTFRRLTRVGDAQNRGGPAPRMRGGGPGAPNAPPVSPAHARRIVAPGTNSSTTHSAGSVCPLFFSHHHFLCPQWLPFFLR